MALSVDTASGTDGGSNGGANTVTVKIKSAVAVGDLLVLGVLISNTSGSVSSVTDGTSNTWHASADVINSTEQVGFGFRIELWSCLGATHTSTANTLVITAHLSAAITAFADCARATGGPALLGNTATNAATSGTALSTSAVANTANNVVFQFGYSGSGTITGRGASFTSLASNAQGQELDGGNLASSGTIAGSQSQSPTSGAWALVMAVYGPGSTPVSDIIPMTGGGRRPIDHVIYRLDGERAEQDARQTVRRQRDRLHGDRAEELARRTVRQQRAGSSFPSFGGHP